MSKFILPISMAVIAYLFFIINAHAEFGRTPGFGFVASAGKIKGVEVWNIQGANSDVDTADVPIDIAEITPTIPNAAQIVTFSSSSSDDADGGTGINKVRIEGLDAGYDEISEIVTLAGVSLVSTTGSYIAINKLTGTLSGSTQSAVGTISAKHGSNVVSSITPLEAVSHQLLYTVPANHIFMLDNVRSSLNKKGAGTATVEFLVMTNGSNTWEDIFHVGLNAVGNSGFETHIGDNRYFLIVGKSKIKGRVRSVDANDNEITASAQGYLIDLGVFKF